MSELPWYDWAVCDDGIAWAAQFDDPNEAWHKCERADWMIFGLLIGMDMHDSVADQLSEWVGYSRCPESSLFPYECRSYEADAHEAKRADLLRELWLDLPLCLEIEDD